MNIIKAYRTILILITVIVLLVSCADLTAPRRHKKESYVVSGLLYVNEYVTPNHPIFLGKTANIEGGNVAEMFILADTIRVTLTEIETMTTINLELNIPQTFYIDSLGYYDPVNALLIKPEHHYKIEAVITDEGITDTIWAVTSTPRAYGILEDDAFSHALPESEDDYPLLKYDTANTEHPLRILANSDSTVAIKFRFYCLEEYQNAYYIQDYPGTDDTPEDEEEYEYPGDGSPRKIEWFYQYTPSMIDGQYTITDRGYKGNLIFYGRYEISIFALDKNYYHYLYKQEGYKYGGINNGIGFFGSVSGQKVYTKVVE